MSKLLDKLEQISEGRAQPLGFGAAVTKGKSLPMVIVASVPLGNAKLAAIAAKAGADALLMTIKHQEKSEEALAKLSSAKTDIPWGVSLNAVTKEEVEQLIEMGCDFVVFAPDKTPAAVLGEERIGKVLQIDSSLSDSLAKAINRLSIDAVLLGPVSEDESPLTVYQLMIYERLAAGAGKYLLAAMPPGLPIDDIQSLWGLGVRGVVVDLAVKDPEQRLSQVKEAIQKLPTTRKKTGERISASLPLPREGPVAAPPEEEEEEWI
jgi:thiamine monophosphate synthase